MKKALILLSLFLTFGCGSSEQGSPKLSQNEQTLLSDAIAECPDVSKLALNAKYAVESGIYTDFIDTYNNMTCVKKELYSRQTFSTIINTKEKSIAYINSLKTNAENSYKRPDTEKSFVAVNYINDNYETFEEAKKDLELLKAMFPEQLDNQDVKVHLVYNFNQAYWDEVLDMMDIYSSFLSWELIWGAYRFLPDEDLEKYAKSHLGENATDLGIAFLVEEALNLRVMLFYNSINFLGESATSATKIADLYQKYADKKDRIITITHRSGTDAFYKGANVIAEKNWCNSVINAGHAIQESYSDNRKPLPVFLGISSDPLYRIMGKEYNLWTESDRRWVLSDSSYMAGFREVYIEDPFSTNLSETENQNFIKYFKNDKTKVTKEQFDGKGLFEKVIKQMQVRVSDCYPKNVAVFNIKDDTSNKVILDLDNIETNLSSKQSFSGFASFMEVTPEETGFKNMPLINPPYLRASFSSPDNPVLQRFIEIETEQMNKLYNFSSMTSNSDYGQSAKSVGSKRYSYWKYNENIFDSASYDIVVTPRFCYYGAYLRPVDNQYYSEGVSLGLLSYQNHFNYCIYNDNKGPGSGYTRKYLTLFADQWTYDMALFIDEVYGKSPYSSVDDNFIHHTSEMAAIVGNGIKYYGYYVNAKTQPTKSGETEGWQQFFIAIADNGTQKHIFHEFIMDGEDIKLMDKTITQSFQMGKKKDVQEN